MLRRLRIQLTLIYMLAGILLEAIMGAGLYWRLSSYYQTSTDLALKYRLAQELRQLQAPVTPALEEAEQEWVNSLNTSIFYRGQFTPEATSTATPTIQPTLLDNETETESNEGGGGSSIPPSVIDTGLTSVKSQNSVLINLVFQQVTPTPTISPVLEVETNPLLESELALIFVMPIGASGSIELASTGQTFPIPPNNDAIQSALKNGVDLRTITSADGVPIRLLTYRLPEGYQARFLQLGRPVDDRIRLLDQYLMGLIAISLIILLFVGLLSWWMAGRSLEPAQRSLEEQQAFIANASHELRTPLTLIRASTELASRATPYGEPKQLLDEVMHDVDYMSKMVEDLLLLSRLDNKRLTIERKPVNLNSLLLDIQNQSQMISKKHNVQTLLLSQDKMVLADPDRLRQVLLILLDNAIQHTPPDGNILIGAEFYRKQIGLYVKDSGAGIPVDALPHIFERFYKTPSHIETQNRGAGLGLSLAKSLIELMHGHIQVQSQPGVGTSFTIILDQSA